jgi:hypothetical protein
MSAQKKSAKQQNKPWYKKPWGIALLVLSVITLTFPIPLIVIIWQKNKLNMAARVIVTAVVGIVYISAITTTTDQSNTQGNETAEQTQETNQPTPKEPEYEIKVVGNSYADPTSRRLTFTVTNLGDRESTPACNVTIENPAGTYRGYDYITWDEPLAPGERGYFEDLIVITNGGAAYATHAEVSCVEKGY